MRPTSTSFFISKGNVSNVDNSIFPLAHLFTENIYKSIKQSSYLVGLNITVLLVIIEV